MIRSVTVKDKKRYYELGSLINKRFEELNDLKEKLDNPLIDIKVFEEKELIKGFIEIENLGVETNVTNIVVDPKYRREHIADTLMMDLLNNTTAKVISLEVRIDNVPAKNLYLKHGFVEKGIRKGYYNGVDAITMVKEL